MLFLFEWVHAYILIIKLKKSTEDFVQSLFVFRFLKKSLLKRFRLRQAKDRWENENNENSELKQLPIFSTKLALAAIPKIANIYKLPPDVYCISNSISDWLVTCYS